MQPLQGVRVLDFSKLLPGPLATLLLAEAGADVIKIEPPSGDEMEDYGPQWEGIGAAYALLNRGKRCVTADLKRDADRQYVLDLAREADVIVEQFRPGVLAKYGLDYESIRKGNPGIIYCSITGYGQTGPLLAQAGHDLNYLAESGVLSLSMGKPGNRVVPPVAIADVAGGSYPALMNILLALRQRDLTGSGMHLDIAMTENMFTLAYLPLAGGLAANAWPSPDGSVVTGASPRYSIYETADGRAIAVGALEDKFWHRLMEAVGMPEVLRDDRADPAATSEALSGLLAEKSAAHWEAVLTEADCCCTIVRTLDEAVSAPHFRERGIFKYRIGNGEGATLPALPLPLAQPFLQPEKGKPQTLPLEPFLLKWNRLGAGIL